MRGWREGDQAGGGGWQVEVASGGGGGGVVTWLEGWRGGRQW